MEDYIKAKLNTKILKKLETVSACINQGSVYNTDMGKVFVKCNSDSAARVMFEGECESLRQLSQTQIVKVPKPLFVGNVGNKFFIVMEYLNIMSLSKHSSLLGRLLAELHLDNIKKLKLKTKLSKFVTSNDTPAVENFGFHVSTSCGYIPQSNEWSDDWVKFYTIQKLQHQINMILKNYGHQNLEELWSQLQLKIPSFFSGINVEPSLLHGDLWIGNAGETNEEPVIYDPASFYGHHEYDLAIAAMFGGYGKQFFDSYHSLIPKSNGFEQRHQLYLLFHHLNHWNHFGSHQDSSVKLMKNLISQKKKNDLNEGN